MSERAPYSRVYWSILHDEKFDGLRQDCRVMGAWMLLLLQADMSWPSPAYLPRPIPKSAIKALADAGIVDLLPDHRYRIHGLDGERERRKSAATRDPVGTQSGPKRDPVGFGVQPPSLAKPSREEPSQAEGARDDIVDDYYRLTGRFPTDTVKEWVDRLANEFGYGAASAELGRQYLADTNLRTLLGRVENELKAGRHIATKREAEVEKARLEAEARSKDISPAQAAENQRALKALYAEWFPKEAA